MNLSNPGEFKEGGEGKMREMSFNEFKKTGPEWAKKLFEKADSEIQGFWWSDDEDAVQFEEDGSIHIYGSVDSQERRGGSVSVVIVLKPNGEFECDRSRVFD